ncbi:unnamed protein product [Schistosoma rodhaini]|uniref:Uncharacterized protein n=2 Tax=Schistosoma rodhaini TaxID=6188 RepID=A0AA85ET03_9TREM|nr:unnamed protein product [Schistosoma rodhaini]
MSCQPQQQQQQQSQPQPPPPPQQQQQQKLNYFHFHKPLHGKIAKTSALCYTWISLGLYSEVLGPTLPTLMYNTKSNYEQIGIALSTRAIGLLFGSLIGGILSDRYKSLRSIFIILSLIVGAITTLIVPWCLNVIILTIILFIAGFSHGFLTTNGNPLLASVWEEKAAGPFSLMHSGYGMGAALAPLLVKPFTIPSPSNNNDTLVTNITTNQQNNTTELVLVNAMIPYSIVAGIVLLCAFYFFIITCIDHSTNSKSNGIMLLKGDNNTKITSSTSLSTNQIFSKKSSKKLNFNYFKLIQTILYEKLKKLKKINLIIISCTFITFFTIVGNERVYGKFMFTYALYGPLKLTLNDSYIINLIYWLCFCLARILIFFISICLSAHIILVTIATGTLISSIGLCILPYKKLWFYICTILFSLFKSPLFPSTLATMNHSIEINGFIIIIVNFGSSFGATILQYTAGRLINLYGQFIFPYLVTGTSILLLLTSLILILTLKHIGNRFNNNDHHDHIIIDTMPESINDDHNDNNDPNDHFMITSLPRSKFIGSKLTTNIPQSNMNPIDHNIEKL